MNINFRNQKSELLLTIYILINHKGEEKYNGVLNITPGQAKARDVEWAKKEIKPPLPRLYKKDRMRIMNHIAASFHDYKKYLLENQI